jgi:hypothetical protein
VATDSNVPITAGSGTPVDAVLLAGGDYQQVVREAPATAASAPDSWALAVSATTSKIAADVGRRAVILNNTSTTGTVYLRYDSTAPTTAQGGWHDRIPPGYRMVLEKELATLVVSFIADVASGYLEIALATAA